MKNRRSDQSGRTRKSTAGKEERGGRRPESVRNQPQLTHRSDQGQPGGGAGRVDIPGKLPSEIRVDPFITEGHSGFDESGLSEISPVERSVEREAGKRGDDVHGRDEP